MSLEKWLINGFIFLLGENLDSYLNVTRNTEGGGEVLKALEKRPKRKG